MLTGLYYWNSDLWNIWIVRTILGNSVEMAVMRRRRYIMKTVLIFLGIVLCFLYISSTSRPAGIGEDNSKFYKERRSDNVKHNGQPIPNEQNIRTVARNILLPEHVNNSIPNKLSLDKNQEILNVVQKTNNSLINSEQDALKNNSKHTLKQTILEVNRKQEIRNLGRFPTRPANAPVLVVMVHKRLEYLRFLIDSFREAKDISETLLIFSHDFYSEDINALIKQIDFCQTMQIFYPYLLQIYENEFPGVDPNDCPRNVDRKKWRTEIGHYKLK
ncbi:alpha-1,6-mannosyl-glycoprotein 2-beta-N-acetylglucosaminyltransferase-like [Anneissia japonica]|uniref:alpha-1,6-mannosyl-glycoprotein 2-beta-N-acetylglucosaminyltransferase-like n=1 Tax=Anneissia japonica TaxID=1529436 RepID=UPI0014258BCA|nr:alpha-1,6-mannosyl-glycoprotein 2-beta-N-acetylglucosaminyltransferase-like [Anneissia japonica]